ncbi:MAG: glycosyl hydrolase 115 family protein [Verrucomicrobiota bacterium]
MKSGSCYLTALLGMGVFICFSALAAPCSAATGDARLSPGVPLLVLPGTPSSVRMAVADLQRDLEKVLGKPSPIIEETKDLHGRPAIVILTDGSTQSAWHEAAVTGREAHGIHSREIDGQNCVVLEGADPRGAIYAIYSFSDEFLNIPPLWYWADWIPTRREAIEIPAGTNRIYPPAHVRWRAWLNNDSDFLEPWQKRTPENDHAMIETVLRLKYNTFELGGVADLKQDAPRYAVRADAAKAHARGLVITHHHTSPLGSGLSSWENFWKHEGKEVPPLSVRNVENLKTFWRYHVETAKRAGLEVVWTVVFRGSRDIPFWETFKDAPTEPADRAHVINEMLQAQVAIVKEVTGDPSPNLRTTFYNEGTTLLTAGLLHPPAEPSLIWNFVAARRDHFPTEFVRNLKPVPGRQLGYYLNFQFTSTGSHLAPAEGPWKMAANYRIVEAAGTEPLAFTVVNAGNNREHLAELSANAEMMWRFKEFEADAFLRNFCTRYYGADHAADLAALYRDYYQSFWRQKQPDIPGFDRQYIFQDMRYARATEMLLKDIAANVSRPNPLEGHPLDNSNTGSVGYFRVEPQPGDRNQLDALLRGTAESGTEFATVVARATAALPSTGPGRLLFNDNLLVRAKIMAALNALLHETTLAYQAQADRPKMKRHLEAAISAADKVKEALDETKHGTFGEWYDSDQKFGLAPLRASFKKECDREQ